MKRPSLTAVYMYGLLVVLFGIVLHAPFSVYIGSIVPELADPIKAWKEITLLLLAILACVIVSRRGLWKQLLSNWVIHLSLGYIVLHLLLVVALPTSLLSSVAGLMIDLRFIVFFILLYVGAMVQPDLLRRSLLTVGAGGLVVIGFGLLQITVLPDDVLEPIGYSQDSIRPFTTIDRNPDFVRINSTLRGPNPLGAVIVIYLGLLLAVVVRQMKTLTQRRKVAIGLLLAALIAVLFASFSRSAYLAAILCSLVVVVAAFRQVPSKRSIAGAVIAAVVVTVSALSLQSTDWYSNVILHEDPESKIVSKSNDEHLASLGNGAIKVLQQPMGNGVGSTGSASLYGEEGSGQIIENYYLFVAHESGWLGLALFLALNFVVLRELWRRRATWPALGLFASGIGLAFIGLLLPLWADETVALIWWGLAGVILGGGYAERTRQ